MTANICYYYANTCKYYLCGISLNTKCWRWPVSFWELLYSSRLITWNLARNLRKSSRSLNAMAAADEFTFLYADLETCIAVAAKLKNGKNWLADDELLLRQFRPNWPCHCAFHTIRKLKNLQAHRPLSLFSEHW